MRAFFATVLAFPTVCWTALLAVCLAYWLAAAGGLTGEHHGDHGGGPEAAGLLGRLGLGGVPAALSLTLLAVAGWLLSYFAHLALLPGVAPALRPLAGAAVLLGSLVLGTLLVGALLRPLRGLLAGREPRSGAGLVGRTGEVASAHVDGTSGRVHVEDGGAGLILEARAVPPDRPGRGTRVVLVAYDPHAHTYLVSPARTGPQGVS